MDFLNNKNAQEAKSLSWFLSWAGIFPLFILALAILFLGNKSGLFPSLADLFKLTSALMLSFLGGIRLGLAISYQPFDIKSIRFSILAPVMGWFALLLTDVYAVMILLVLYCALGAWDSFYVNAGKAPPWYGSIRMMMTFLIAIIHIIAVVALSDGISLFA